MVLNEYNEKGEPNNQCYITENGAMLMLIDNMILNMENCNFKRVYDCLVMVRDVNAWADETIDENDTMD